MLLRRARLRGKLRRASPEPGAADHVATGELEAGREARIVVTAVLAASALTAVAIIAGFVAASFGGDEGHRADRRGSLGHKSSPASVAVEASPTPPAPSGPPVALPPVPTLPPLPIDPSVPALPVP